MMMGKSSETMMVLLVHGHLIGPNYLKMRPRRSFDMRQQRLFDQLDAEERKVVEVVAPELRRQ
jgi:hypothetical protein